MTSKIKNICVYCGASSGVQPAYAAAAHELANVFLAADITLVYGGANVGIMGAIADRMLEGGGKAIGVMPDNLIKNEIAHPNLTELHVVKTMSERKALLHQISDAFIMLPGGIGTLDEFFEMITLAQIGLHNKPRGILNTAGYYNDLIKFMDHAVTEDFWNPVNRKRVFIEEKPALLLQSLLDYHAPLVNRWVTTETETV